VTSSTSTRGHRGDGLQGMPLEVDEVPSFDEATHVVFRAFGQYDTYIHPAWDGLGAPNGGILAAALLRAARRQLARPDLPPRTLSVHFPQAAVNGAAQINVEVLREGRSTALVCSELFQQQKLVCTALLTFSSARDEAMPIAATAPAVPPWQEVNTFDYVATPGTPPCFARIEPRPCLGQRPFSGTTEALTGGWMQLRSDTTDVDAERLVALSDMWWPAVHTAANGIVRTPTLELCHFRTATAVKAPVLGRFNTTTLREGHFDETAQLWSQDGTLLAETRQLAQLTPRPSTHPR
jgi:acyl-CoA thioesterase